MLKLSGMNFDLITLAIFLLSISIHEAAHAATADYLGDPTARLAGRKTLNPLAHIDMLGLFAMLLFGFGWARPVPVDPFNLKNPRRDNLFISLAGPASQVVLSIILAIIYHAINYVFVPADPLFGVSNFILVFIQINLILAFFNLLPFYPLDGYSVVLGILPQDYARQWEDTKQYGLILLAMIILLPNKIISLSKIIGVPVQFFFQLFRLPLF